VTEPAEVDEWHRRFGAALFNRTWELIDAADRSDDHNAEMLLTAAASRWHWGRVGGPEETASGDWQVAHVASLIGYSDLAVAFAHRNVSTALAEGWDGWRLASAHEGMARALAAAGDATGRAEHITLARAALEREDDAEDRGLIASQIESVPDA
jgi:hypothetical protein